MYKLINRLWRWNSRREARAFRHAVHHPAETQFLTLQRQLRVLAPSERGRRWDLNPSLGVPEFRRRVPLTGYDDYRDAIEQIEISGANSLTTEKVLLLEPTSGTSAGEKLIPYTPALRTEFQRAVAVWIDDLFTRRPQLMQGRAYWSVSPPLSQRRQSASGIPIGFDDDTAYLGFWSRRIVKRLLAVPPQVTQMSGAQAWKYATLWYLLLAGDLTLISVWSPTFVTELTRSLSGPWRAMLARDLLDGKCRGPLSTTEPMTELRTSQARNRRLQVSRLLDGEISGGELRSRLWPSLAAISCWTDAAAAHHVPQLRREFAGVEILAKGLLSTEGCVTIPLVDMPGGAHGAAIPLLRVPARR